VYMDDIVIFPKTHEEHEEHVRTVLNRLKEHRLFCKASKCELFKEQIQFLGHVVTAGGVKMEPEKIAAIKK